MVTAVSLGLVSFGLDTHPCGLRSLQVSLTVHRYVRRDRLQLGDHQMRVTATTGEGQRHGVEWTEALSKETCGPLPSHRLTIRSWPQFSHL